VPEQPGVTKEKLLEALAIWKDYPAGIECLPAAKKAAFLEKQGYPNTHALLSHITGWWEETIAIVEDTLAGHEPPRREYDFDVFNAESIARFKSWPEADLLLHYEVLRQKLIVLVSGLTDEQLQTKRVSNWLHGVVVDHAEEHAIS
jgi:hypothetical protein